MTAVRKVYRFYRYECCFPYTLSFLLVLFIYAIDFYAAERPLIWPSGLSYLILVGYYIQNTRYYKKNALTSEDPQFFVLLLTLKIVLWGALLVGLVISA